MAMLRSSVFVAAFVLVTVPLSAHHGPGSFDLAKTVTFENAKLTRIELINPHSWLYFETTNPDGTVQKHRCEMRSAHTLRRSGWEPELFKVGAKMTVTASPDKADIASCYLQTINFDNGNRMDRYGQYIENKGGKVTEVRGQVAPPDLTKRAARRPDGKPNLTGDWAPEQQVMANASGTGGGLVGLSTLGERDRQAASGAGGAPRGGGAARAGGGGGGGRRAGGAPGAPRLYGGTELTALGEQEAAAFKTDDNPRFKCETTSILFDWTFDGPVNRITQNKDTIVIQYGQMSLKRTVYMNLKQHPANIKPSRTGHSIGSWDGDTLVVDTVGFLPGFITTPVKNSDKLHVVERFTLDPKTMKLTREYAADDSVYLKGQYKGSDVVEVADKPYTADVCKDQTKVDYSKQVSSAKR
jgi:hypothetical protein